MAIQFHCPHCGAAQNAEERYAGLTGPCTACGKILSVPGGKGMSPGAAAATGAGVGGVLLIVGIVSLVLLLGCGGVLVALLLPAIAKAREAARRSVSLNNSKQIMLALHNYHDAHRTFPPAYIPDKDGKPMTSWRVLILPFIEQQGLYSQYDFSKPWDSPENLALANNMPAVYRSPLEGEDAQTRNHTSYLLFTGKGTLFEKPGNTSISAIVDGTSNTIAFAEVNKSGVLWTQPTDLDAEQLDFAIRDMKNAQPGQLNSALSNGLTVGMFDGSVRVLSNQTPPPEIRSAVNPNDGRAANLDGF